MTSSNFIIYWRQAEAVLRANRWPPLQMGLANMYWQLGFSPELAAEAATFRRFIAPRKVH